MMPERKSVRRRHSTTSSVNTTPNQSIHPAQDSVDIVLAGIDFIRETISKKTFLTHLFDFVHVRDADIKELFVNARTRSWNSTLLFHLKVY